MAIEHIYESDYCSQCDKPFAAHSMVDLRRCSSMLGSTRRHTIEALREESERQIIKAQLRRD